MVRQPPKLSGFPKPLRNLLSLMLHPNPDRRPKDLVALGEMIRSCLLKIERRLRTGQSIWHPAQDNDSPADSSLARDVCCERHWRLARSSWLRRCVGAVLFPNAIGGILHRSRATKSIGVLVGVPEASPTPAAGQSVSTPVAPATVLSQAANAALALANQPATQGASHSEFLSGSSAGSATGPNIKRATAGRRNPGRCRGRFPGHGSGNLS